jgi:hypothetical protein
MHADLRAPLREKGNRDSTFVCIKGADAAA